VLAASIFRSRVFDWGETVPVLGDAGQNIFAVDAKTFRFDDELLDLAAEEFGAFFACGVRAGGDDVADAWPGFEKAVADKLRDDLVGGIGIDLEFAAEGTNRGEWVAGKKLTRDHRLLRRIDDLLEERDAGPEMDAERNHDCTITHSTVVREELFSSLERDAKHAEEARISETGIAQKINPEKMENFQSAKKRT